MGIAIFVDCGDVLFDGKQAGPQWKRMAGRYFSSRFGGNPDEWGRANEYAYRLYSKQYRLEAWGHPEMDYNAFQQREMPRMIARMFEQMGIELPSPNTRMKTWASAQSVCA